MNHKLSCLAALLVSFGVLFHAAPALALSICGVPDDFTQADIENAMHSYAKTISAPLRQGGYGLRSGVNWDSDTATSDDKACAYYARGYLHQQMGNFDDALRDYTSALDIVQRFPEALAGRGDLYIDLHQPDKADADYAAERPFRVNAAAQNSICWARLMRGRPLDRALAACNNAITQEPKSSDYLQSRCMVNIRLKNYAAAIADCSAALDAADDITALARAEAKAQAYYPRGLAKLRAGDAAGGNADIAAATDIDPKIADTYANYGFKP